MWTRKLFATVLCALATSSRAQNGYFQPNSTGIRLQNGFERVYVQPYGPHGVRVRASRMRDPSGTEPSAFLFPPLDGPHVPDLSVSELVPYGNSSAFRNGNLLVSVNSGRLEFYRIEPSGQPTLLTSEYADTKSLPARQYRQDFRASSFEAAFSFSSDSEEQFYGTGQQACCNDHSVNKKGQVVDLINYNSHVTLPVYMSNKGYLQYFNMPSQGRIEFSTYNTRFVADEATVVDYFITTAPPGDYDALQEYFTAVTGRQPTPPEFMLGYQQSKLRYLNQSQVLDVAQRFHDENVPVSLMVIDFFAWKYQGDWSFNDPFWPDPAAMAAKVKELTGAELMVSLWPSVEDKSVNYVDLQRQGLLATTRDGTGITDSFEGVYTRLIDSTNPAAREFLWKRLNESYFSKGIKNFWIDQADGGTLGEPFLNNGQDLIKAAPYARTFAQYHLGTQEAVGKLYPWAHELAIDEGLRNLTDSPASSTSCEYMGLTRSTFVGGQRFCTYLWSGDTDSKFDVIAQQITAGVSVAASGISAWTLDIGGFAGLNIDTDEGKELFVRWFGLGVFLPFTRVHGTRTCNSTRDNTQVHGNTCPNEPWSYGPENFEIIKKYIGLRYQLVPYVKTLFCELQRTGKSIMRPLYYDFSLSDPFVAQATERNDPKIVHQYLFGPRLLVAPVYVVNATEREVYLPHLTDAHLAQNLSWTHWWSEEAYGVGGRAVNVSAPLDQIPVFYLGTKEEILAGKV